MKKRTQVILLFGMLALPALAFIFLNSAGENRFELPVMNPRAVNCSPNLVDSVHRVPDFSFVDQQGKAFTKQDLEGKIFVADFFFTRCPNICIEMTAELLRVQEIFENNPDIAILSHSVDPSNDSPEVLQDYAKKNGINTDFWTLVTGNKEAIYEQARCGYYIVAKPNEADANDFIHSDKLMLVDKDMRIRGYYSGTDREDVDRLITEIRVLQLEYEQES